MADLRDETPEDGFHEIQLSGKQLVFLFMLTTVLSIFIFLVGVLVGRDVAAKPGGDPIPTPPVTSSELQSEPGDGSSPPAEAPPATPADDLGYADRVQTDPGGKPEKLPPPAPEPKPEPAKPEVSKPEPPPEAAAKVPTSGRPGTWVIQVVALRDRAAAAATVQRLAGQGYPAFLENPAPGTPRLYRVRIGRYNDRREAEQVGRRLQKEEQFNPAIMR